MKHTFSKQLLRISLTGLVTLLLLALGSNVLVGGQGPMPQQTAASQADGIDEVVVVGTDGYVYAYDYTGQLVYQSPGNGWSLAATGDFNRDGDDEIVAVGGNRIKVFDPQVNGTEYSLSRTYSGSTGTFTKVAVGHLVGDDNQLDIALLRSRGGTVSRIVIYRTSKAAPAVDYEFPYSNWDDFAVADFDGDGDDDFALIYWNNNYPDGVKSWLELWKGHDPSQRLQGSSNNGRYSNLEWFDIAAGNFVTTNGDRVEWVGAQNVNNVVVQQWKDERIRDVWAVGPAFEFVAAADFRGDGDDQVAMLRNVTSGVSLQFARSGDARFKPWAKTSGLGTGWLNLAAGNLDTETKYKEAVIIKNNLIRVYLR
ncbi:MAG: FG-GAP repeat domain-containing protein, partial [Anaerolineae bacterium]